MTRRLKSLAARFPLLLGGIVLLIALVTAQMVEREIGAVLVQARGVELSTGASRVAGLLGAGLPSLARQLDSVAARPQYARLLAGSAGAAEGSRVLAAAASDGRDTTRVLVQLLGPRGELRGSHRVGSALSSRTWASAAASEGTLSRDSLSISPILELEGGLAGFGVATPVRDAVGRHLGWLVEVRKIQARGVEDVRALIGVQTMLIGQVDAGVWTDLQSVVDPPAPIQLVDTATRVHSDARGDAVGIAKPIPGTPWVLWVEAPATEVLAPVTALFSRLWPTVGAITLLGAVLAWLLAYLSVKRIRAVARDIDHTLAVRDAATTVGPVDELEALERAYKLLEGRVTHQRRLDDQFLQSQKLEAVGRLAGGVAHDFNNLLTVVSNFGELVRERLPANSAEAADMDEVLRASDRAAALTRQLLAFSRQHIVDPHPLDVNAVIMSADRMLVRMIPSNIERTIELATDLPKVTADSVHLEQVLMNLVLNAVDALPKGGRLSLRTTREELTASTGPDGDLPAGPHVCIAVSDSGVGMDAATLARVFDPFFTTKPLGKGTGLGLATVHGIVGQAHGRIYAYSEPGLGTTMKVYLPASATAEEVEQAPTRSARVRTPAHGLVLVVEDDPGTRLVTSRQLSRQGYTVREFDRADLAIEWLNRAENALAVRVVVSDVMMPGMSGVEFARAAGLVWPKLPFVLMSGYAGMGVDLNALTGQRPVTLDKPFTSAALLDAVDRALGKPGVNPVRDPPPQTPLR